MKRLVRNLPAVAAALFFISGICLATDTGTAGGEPSAEKKAVETEKVAEVGLDALEGPKLREEATKLLIKQYPKLKSVSFVTGDTDENVKKTVQGFVSLKVKPTTLPDGARLRFGGFKENGISEFEFQSDSPPTFVIRPGVTERGEKVKSMIEITSLWAKAYTKEDARIIKRKTRVPVAMLYRGTENDLFEFTPVKLKKLTDAILAAPLATLKKHGQIVFSEFPEMLPELKEKGYVSSGGKLVIRGGANLTAADWKNIWLLPLNQPSIQPLKK